MLSFANTPDALELDVQLFELIKYNPETINYMIEFSLHHPHYHIPSLTSRITISTTFTDGRKTRSANVGKKYIMFINYSSPKTIVLETKIIDPLPRDRDEMVEVKFTTEIQDAVVDTSEDLGENGEYIKFRIQNHQVPYLIKKRRKNFKSTFIDAKLKLWEADNRVFDKEQITAYKRYNTFTQKLKRATALEASLGYYFYVSTLLFSEIADLNRATTQTVITRLKADLKLEDAQSVSHEKFWSIDNDSEEEEPTASDRDEAINQDAENTTAEERLD
ncbi:hypothetical protein BC833DRAFT_652316 [Globomyces pollinis-pini]|nr:hypothetical protein BC833DRAFT_652316 [Globomyces pollinis-pini]